MQKYQAINALRFFEGSGLVEKIRNSKGEFQIDLRKIPIGAGSTRHQHHDHEPVDNPNYFRFVIDHVSAVLEVIGEESCSHARITSKHFRLDEAGVELFNKAYPILKENYGKSGPAGI